MSSFHPRKSVSSCSRCARSSQWTHWRKCAKSCPKITQIPACAMPMGTMWRNTVQMKMWYRWTLVWSISEWEKSAWCEWTKPHDLNRMRFQSSNNTYLFHIFDVLEAFPDMSSSCCCASISIWCEWARTPKILNGYHTGCNQFSFGLFARFIISDCCYFRPGTSWLNFSSAYAGSPTDADIVK